VKTVDQLLHEARERLAPRVPPQDVAAALAAGGLLIDIRSDSQRQRDGLIADAVLMPRNSLEWRCDPTSAWRDPRILDHDQHLILVCNEGFQSSLAAANLQTLGLRNATDMAGGFVAWKRAGLPVIPFGRSEPEGRDDASAVLEARWEAAYGRSPEERSWHQREPAMSLRMLERCGIPTDAAVLDAGGGGSALAATLARRGYTDITVVDVSQRGLDACADGLGAARARVRLVRADLLSWQPGRRFDVWHDRAVLHFFVDVEQRIRYVNALRAALEPGGVALIGVFGETGPDRCSGQPVMRYSAAQLAQLLGDDFALLVADTEVHVSSRGAHQRFQWAAFRYDGGAPATVTAAGRETLPR